MLALWEYFWNWAPPTPPAPGPPFIGRVFSNADMMEELDRRYEGYRIKRGAD